ncbi:hypothetical protein JVT61DRAFT_2891 [Boletus reticuloceps]|uniref:Uncharacterized protein n=1 Tax=Boletus reticuloceps TaxID=495285 RepID=A0A8I3A8P2_9AGAM|nr:hypothetical protein JVT61DRAFT_2891 [Boletus reticuloceps]
MSGQQYVFQSTECLTSFLCTHASEHAQSGGSIFVHTDVQPTALPYPGTHVIVDIITYYIILFPYPRGHHYYACYVNQFFCWLDTQLDPSGNINGCASEAGPSYCTPHNWPGGCAVRTENLISLLLDHIQHYPSYLFVQCVGLISAGFHNRALEYCISYVDQSDPVFFAVITQHDAEFGSTLSQHPPCAASAADTLLAEDDHNDTIVLRHQELVEGDDPDGPIAFPWDPDTEEFIDQRDDSSYSTPPSRLPLTHEQVEEIEERAHFKRLAGWNPHLDATELAELAWDPC